MFTHLTKIKWNKGWMIWKLFLTFTFGDVMIKLKRIIIIIQIENINFNSRPRRPKLTPRVNDILRPGSTRISLTLGVNFGDPEDQN